MTGGQTSPTTIIGQRTTSDKYGKDIQNGGEVFDIIPTLYQYDIGFLARGMLTGSSYIKKAFEIQIEYNKHTFIELLSPCPTNWKKEPVEANEVLKNSIGEVFKTGIFKEVKLK